jgi:hypothetical protein
VSLSSLTAQQLRHAAAIKEKIALLERELDKIAVYQAPPKPKPPVFHVLPIPAAKKSKGKLSHAAIANIRAAQKKRWAKIKRVKV